MAFAIVATTDAQNGLRSRVYATGFNLPVAFVQDPIDRTVQYVVEQSGRIRAVRAGTVLPTVFLDLTASIASGGERGLLGLAFAPDYTTSGRSQEQRTEPVGVPRQDASPRHQRARLRSVGLSHSAGQSVSGRRAGSGPSGNLELRAAKSMAVHVRRPRARRHRRDDHRRRRS